MMMKTILFFSLFCFSFLAVKGQGGKWQLDRGHSSLGFSVSHMGIAEFNGTFDKFDVKVTTSGADFTDATIELTAEVASVNTGNEMRDKHLAAEDFFDAGKFPTMTFKSKSVKKKGKNYVIVGEFTFHGVSKLITLNAKHNGTLNLKDDGKDLQIAGFEVSGSIKRSEFGIAPDFKDIADEIFLDADLEIYKQ
jgi:polyisoprenoid-binding protein YceI